MPVTVIAMSEEVFPYLKEEIASAYLKVDWEAVGTAAERATRKRSYLLLGGATSSPGELALWKRVPSC